MISILLSVVGAALLIVGPQPTFGVFGASVFVLVALGDCVDGNIARASGQSGPRGIWIDALCGYTVYALLPLSLGLQLERAPIVSVFPGMWVLIGAVTAISNMFLRVVHQKFINVMGQSTAAGPEPGEDLFTRVDAESGLIGLMMPVLLFATILRFEPLYLVLYCLFYLAAAVVAPVVIARRLRSA